MSCVFNLCGKRQMEMREKDPSPGLTNGHPSSLALRIQSLGKTDIPLYLSVLFFFFSSLLSTGVKIPELCLDVPKRSHHSLPLLADKASFHHTVQLCTAAGQEQQWLFS